MITTILGYGVILLLFMGPASFGLFDLDPYFPWTAAAGVTLMYSVANSVLSLGAIDLNQYWGRSIICFMILIIVGIATSWLITGMNIYEAKSYRELFIVFTFVYLVFLCLARAMRKVVKIALKQDARLRGEIED